MDCYKKYYFGIKSKKNIIETKIYLTYETIIFWIVYFYVNLIYIFFIMFNVNTWFLDVLEVSFTYWSDYSKPSSNSSPLLLPFSYRSINKYILEHDPCI